MAERWLGLDIGSRQVKWIWQESEGPLQFGSMLTPQFYAKFVKPGADGRRVLDLAGLQLPVMDRICATGYGRQALGLALATVVSEIQAHAAGAASQETGEFLVLDVGGQDAKVIWVKDQRVQDFAINDKCAAGSGRYLENMAEVLGISLDHLFRCHLEPADLTTTCATYAESEVIGKVAEGVPMEQLCAGVNHAMFLRLLPMLERWPVKRLFFVGGTATNQALVHYLEQTGYQVRVPERPQFNGALGCLQILKQELHHAS